MPPTTIRSRTEADLGREELALAIVDELTQDDDGHVRLPARYLVAVAQRP